MRVLLVNTNSKADLLAAPPLGAACVAEAARAAGHEVRLLDLCFVADRDRALEREIRTFRPGVVGLSVRNLDNANLLRPVSYVEDARQVAAKVRELTRVPLVLGGSGASLCPGELLRELKADVVVAGDGEKAFVALLAALEEGRPPRDIPGVGFLEGDQFCFVPPAFSDAAFTSPDLAEWVDLPRYAKMGSSYAIQTKRGCCQNCIYCTYNQSLEGRRLRLRPPAEVVAEIEEAVLRQGIREFDFVDSVFNEPVGHCREILEGIVRRPWKARFTAMGMSPQGMDREFVALLWSAGFRSFMMTPDSASESMIRGYGKGFGVDDLVTAAAALDGTRFTVMWFFLIGGPGETLQTLGETLAFTRKHLVRSVRPPYHMAEFFLGVRVYPRTRMWDVAVREGQILSSSDPLGPLWYVSRSLDIDRAVDQLVEASLQHPEISLGFDERYLSLSGAVSALGRLFRLPKPYWRHLWAGNRLMIRSGLRRWLRPRHAAAQIQARLAAQMPAR